MAIHKDILKPVGLNPVQAIITDSLQIAGIIENVIAEYPAGTPFRILQTTFSISEEFLRRMYFIRKKHNCILETVIDRKALQKTIQLWNFVSKVYDRVWLGGNHSKILIIKPQDYPPVAMLTSQNLTRGHRFESYLISTLPEIAGPLEQSFNDLCKYHTAPMHELMKTPDNTENTENTDNPGNTDTCSQIERLAGYFIPIQDISVILGLPIQALRDLIADPDSPEGLAYRRGKAKAKVAIRAQEMELAKVGSPLGMMSVRENLLSMEADED